MQFLPEPGGGKFVYFISERTVHRLVTFIILCLIFPFKLKKKFNGMVAEAFRNPGEKSQMFDMFVFYAFDEGCTKYGPRKYSVRTSAILLHF
jgi:hypothetical protein